MFPVTFLQLSVFEEPVFEPRYLNVEYFFNMILRFSRGFIDFLHGSRQAVSGSYLVPDLTPFVTAGWVISGVLFLLVLYAIHKRVGVAWEEHEKFSAAESRALESYDQTERNTKWMKVVDLLGMINESDWRLAIMEADNILKEMLGVMGYHGDTIGDQLKSVEKSDFLTLSDAWEAHKVRNRIAHEGTDFRLSQREAQRIIGLYENVFKEFHYI